LRRELRELRADVCIRGLVSTTTNTLKGRGSGIKAKRGLSKSGRDVSLAVTEVRRHWQAVAFFREEK
jgi:hypothetical protein